MQKWLDKNEEEIKVGMYLKDKEGTYEVVDWDGELAISSDNSIWKLSQFLSYDNILLDFEIVPSFTCNLCGSKFLGYGNNPWPLCDDNDYESRCCDDCDNAKVIPARIKLAFERRK